MLAGVQDDVRGCARFLGCFVEATANLCGESKVIFEMRDVFEKNCLMIESDVIEEHQVLMYLPHVADVGHDWQTDLLCHQADGEKLADASEPGAIRLDEMYSSIVEKVLEEDAIGYVLTRCDSYRCELARERHMRVHIVWVGWLFYP
jgi:hypothetical protein